MSVCRFEGMKPDIANGAWVHESALVLGDVKLGEDASIWPMAVVRGDIHSIEIGPRSNIQDGSVVHVTHSSHFNPGGYPVVVGSGNTVGHNVTLHGCTIEDHCLIGMGSVVMDGSLLHSKLVLGAGSLVPPGKELEGGHLWVGRPAKRVRPLTEEELEMLEYSAASYVGLKDRYMKEGG